MRNLIVMFILVLLAFSSSAQEPRKLDLSKAVASFQKKILVEEQNATRLKAKLEKTDQEIDSKLTGLIKKLIKARDSNETRTLIIRNKKKIISDLEKSQKTYLNEKSMLDKDQAMKEVPEIDNLKVWINKKINKNIKEITTVADSLAHYREYYDDDWRNTYNDRRNVKYADKEKQRIVKNFEKQTLALNKKLIELDAVHDMSESTSEYMDKCIKACDEVKEVNTRILLLEHSMDDIINGGNDGSKVGKTFALNLDREIRKETSEIRGQLKSFIYTFNLYKRSLVRKNKLNNELKILNRLNK